jgi:hypothetical protein
MIRSRVTTLRVAVDHRPVRRRQRPEAEAVDDTRLGPRAEIGEHVAEPTEVGHMEPVTIDVARRNHAHGDACGDVEHDPQELLSHPGLNLLRVVEQSERPRAMAV